MKIINDNGEFYIPDSVVTSSTTVTELANLAVPYEVYELQEELARLKSIQYPTDEQLIAYAKQFSPDITSYNEAQSRIEQINNQLAQQWQQ
jgi:hypothetical protein